MFLDELVYLLNEARPDLFVLNSSVFDTSRSTLPPGNGPYCSIKETGGSGPNHTQNLTVGLPWQGRVAPANQHPSAQLLFTASTYQAARDFADAAYYILIQVGNREVGPALTFYRDLKPLQEPIDLNPDPKGRARVAFNVIADKNPSLPVLACQSIRPFPSASVVGGPAERIGFVVRYNMWMVVGGSPTIVARSSDSGVLPDQTLTYDAADSDLQGLGFGDIAFTAYGDFTVPSGVTLTVDSGSVISGWDGITDAAGRPLPSPALDGKSAMITVTV